MDKLRIIMEMIKEKMKEKKVEVSIVMAFAILVIITVIVIIIKKEQIPTGPVATPMVTETVQPTKQPEATPTKEPTAMPTATPTVAPTSSPSPTPTEPPKEDIIKEKDYVISGSKVTYTDNFLEYVKSFELMQALSDSQLETVLKSKMFREYVQTGKDYGMLQITLDYTLSRYEDVKILIEEALGTLPAGWVTPTPTPVPEFTYTKENVSSYMYTTAKVYIRKGPSTAYEQIDLLKSGTRVYVCCRCNETGWYHVYFDLVEGYMSDKYLTTAAPTPTATPSPTVTPSPEVTPDPEITPGPEEIPDEEVTPSPEVIPSPTPTSEYTFTDVNRFMYATSGVNVRDLPSTAGTKVGKLSKNATVEVLRQCTETGWYEFEYNGMLVYASNNYLKLVEPITGQSSTEE